MLPELEPRSPTEEGGDKMGVEENAAIGRRLVDILNERDWDAHFELIAEDCEWEDVPAGSITRGPQELVEDIKSFVAAFPDIHVETLRVIAQGDLVAIEWRGRGTHTGKPIERGGVVHQPTGRSFVRDGVGIAQLRDGKVVSYRDHFDRLQMYEQVGW
jgi:ketosteroid isomerase-like protein